MNIKAQLKAANEEIERLKALIPEASPEQEYREYAASKFEFDEEYRVEDDAHVDEAFEGAWVTIRFWVSDEQLKRAV
jgi:hypothetical protein